MGLSYSYWIYLKKQNLKKALEFVYNHSDEQSVGFKIENERLYKIERDSYFRPTKVLLDHFGLQRTLETCILVEEDEVIMEDLLHRVEHTVPKYADQNEALNQFKGKDNKWCPGVIMISIEKDPRNLEDCIVLHFWTLTSSMSRLFANSKSIDKYFKALCRTAEAESGLIGMEGEGQRIIWNKGQEYDLHLPLNWQENAELVKVVEGIFGK